MNGEACEAFIAIGIIFSLAICIGFDLLSFKLPRIPLPHSLRRVISHFRTRRCTRSTRCRCQYITDEETPRTYCVTHGTIRILTAAEVLYVRARFQQRQKEL